MSELFVSKKDVNSTQGRINNIIETQLELTSEQVKDLGKLVAEAFSYIGKQG